MGYDTWYTITIEASTLQRRIEIAESIIKNAWLPYIHRKLEDDEFSDPILNFQNRSWRSHELMDLAGAWYDGSLKTDDSYLGNIRGINLKEGEKIVLIGEGDDNEDVYRIIATQDTIFREIGNVSFVNKSNICDNMGEDEVDDNGSPIYCSGCQACATRVATFKNICFEATSTEQIVNYLVDDKGYYILEFLN